MPHWEKNAKFNVRCFWDVHGEMFLGCFFQGRNKASIVVGVTEDKVKNLDLLGLESF